MPDKRRDSSGVRHRRPAPWELAARAARRQANAISLAQLLEAGLRADQIAHAVRTGRLHPERRGVYRMSATPLAYRGREFAGLLATGAASRLSDHSAVVRWGLLPEDDTAIHVVTPTQRRSRRGLIVHQATLVPRDCATRNGLRVTGLARTLLDAAVSEPQQVYEVIVVQAQIIHKRLIRHAWEILERIPGHHGVPLLRSELQRNGHDPGSGELRGPLEAQFWQAMRPYVDRIPSYERNVQLRIDDAVYTPDLVFAAQKVIVELDSRSWHDNDPRFDSDRRRDQRLMARGWRVFRITARHLRDHPDATIADLLTALGVERV